jgi:hypothetical protein
MTVMKSPQNSKINWIGLTIFILTFLQDPKFLDFIPQEVGLWIFRIAALLIIVIRTIWTNVVCVAPAQDLTPDQIHNLPVDAVVKEALDKIGGRMEP